MSFGGAVAGGGSSSAGREALLKQQRAAQSFDDIQASASGRPDFLYVNATVDKAGKRVGAIEIGQITLLATAKRVLLEPGCTLLP